VELQELWIDLGGDTGTWVAVGARNDCLKSAAADYAIRALSVGKVAEATFHLSLVNRTRPIQLKISAPRRIDFDRREARVVRIVRDWVVARGFMPMPDHLRATASDAPSEPTSAGGASRAATRTRRSRACSSSSRSTGRSSSSRAASRRSLRATRVKRCTPLA
jgi:hypothetical protein